MQKDGSLNDILNNSQLRISATMEMMDSRELRRQLPYERRQNGSLPWKKKVKRIKYSPHVYIVKHSHVTGAFKYYTGFVDVAFDCIYKFLVVSCANRGGGAVEGLQTHQSDKVTATEGAILHDTGEVAFESRAETHHTIVSNYTAVTLVRNFNRGVGKAELQFWDCRCDLQCI